MDIFQEYITKNKRKDFCQALTDSSFKIIRKEVIEIRAPNYMLEDGGASLLEFALNLLFPEESESSSEKKTYYKSNKFLIEKVAKHYDLLEYLNFNRDNTSIVQEYKYVCGGTEFIATAVKAVLQAIFVESTDLQSIIDLVESWTKL